MGKKAGDWHSICQGNIISGKAHASYIVGNTSPITQFLLDKLLYKSTVEQHKYL